MHHEINSLNWRFEVGAISQATLSVLGAPRVVVYGHWLDRRLDVF
ncbi:hypothetical protein RMSM_01626 [Rhodopirellula maiorica SM1]|uniref:Uncharacterized protein n=1 Tax=Rhodopirellula maiorica SM1 TaxID=1265738 RepID=M5RQ73_9BACT|nr:hypothetical protein [Rhodopirellula maiorica]EMI21440.1 hypothetical protein RMSM_01626 [Rhodopirellula maiorica SM1]